MNDTPNPTLADVAQFHFALNNVRVRMGLVDEALKAEGDDCQVRTAMVEAVAELRGRVLGYKEQE